MVRIDEQKKKLARWITFIGPGILKKLNLYITESAFFHAIFFRGNTVGEAPTVNIKLKEGIQIIYKMFMH